MIYSSVLVLTLSLSGTGSTTAADTSSRNLRNNNSNSIINNNNHPPWSNGGNKNKEEIVRYWSKEKRKAAKEKMLYVDDDASPGNGKSNNNKHRLLASCSDFNGDKWGCASAGGTCSYNKRTKRCTGELDGGGSDGDSGSVSYVSDAAWVTPTRDGDIHEAAGRLYFVSGGNTYWCSATAITDGDVNNGITTADTSNGRSLILTAAHCVFDEVSDEVSFMIYLFLI